MTGLIIFIGTYVFIAGARIPRVALDRPGGALLGAVAMVALGVVTPEEVFGGKHARAAINYDTILLLLGMMLLAGYLTEAAFFRWTGRQALKLAHSPRALLATVTVVSGVLPAYREDIATALKKALGTGARVDGDDVVVQGDLVDRTLAALARELEKQPSAKLIRGT